MDHDSHPVRRDDAPIRSYRLSAGASSNCQVPQYARYKEGRARSKHGSGEYSLAHRTARNQWSEQATPSPGAARINLDDADKSDMPASCAFSLVVLTNLGQRRP